MLDTPTGRVNARGRDFLSLGHLTGYDDWQLYKELLQISAAGLFRRELLIDAIDALKVWDDSPETSTRSDHLVSTLRPFPNAVNAPKVLLFAGYPDLAEELAASLSGELGEDTVVEFRAEMTREAKEASADRFQRDPKVRFLVSDETGGEGRNFQFADAVAHYDHPWQLARVEQRIGRLDRIGRTRYREDVLSLVICAAGTVQRRDGTTIYANISSRFLARSLH